MAKKKTTEIDQTFNDEPPAKDIKLGDLTPAYIEWFAKNHTPQEFHAKYIKMRQRVPREYWQYFVR